MYLFLSLLEKEMLLAGTSIAPTVGTNLGSKFWNVFTTANFFPISSPVAVHTTYPLYKKSLWGQHVAEAGCLLPPFLLKRKLRRGEEIASESRIRKAKKEEEEMEEKE